MKKCKVLFISLSFLIVLAVMVGSFFAFLQPRVEAANEYIDASNIPGLQMEKSLIKNNDYAYSLQLDTYTTEKVEYYRDTVYSPVDIIFVVDCSNSMTFNMHNDLAAIGNPSRMDYSKDAMIKFLDEIVSQSKAHGNLDCRLSMISYGHALSYTARPYNGHLSVIDDYQTIKKAINNLEATKLGGCTHTQLAMEKALDVLNNIKGQSGYSMEDRKRVVVLFTDGAPTQAISSLVDQFNENVANGAIAAANTIKNSAFVYTVGIGEGIPSIPPVPDCDTFAGDATETKNNYGRFLQYVSSNYNEAKTLQGSADITAPQIGTDSVGKPVYDSYCYTTNDADVLKAAFESIAEEIVVKEVISESVDNSTVIKDFMTPYFEVDTSIPVTVYKIPYIGYDSAGKRVFDEGKWLEISADTEVYSDRVYVKNLDYSGNIVSDTTDLSGNTTYNGYKFRIRIPIKPKDGFLGGNNVPTNTEESGVYSDNNDVCWGTFVSPTVDVPLKTLQSLSADEMNVYAGQLYTKDELINNAVVTFNDGAWDVNVDGVINYDVPQDMLEAAYNDYKTSYYQTNGVEITDADFQEIQPSIYEEVKQKYNYGLEPWENEFVNIEDLHMSDIGYYSNFGKFYQGEYYFQDAGFYGNGSSDIIDIYTSISLKDDPSKVSTKSIGADVNVFHPQITYSDAVVKYGQIVSEFDPTPYFSFENIEWMSDSIKATNVKMLGEVPTLIYDAKRLYWSNPFIVNETDDGLYCNDGRVLSDTAIYFFITSEEFMNNPASSISCIHEPSPLHNSCSPDETELPDGAKMWLHTSSDNLCELTIQKTGSSSNDINQTFVFHIISEHDNYDYEGYEDIERYDGWCYEYVKDENGNYTIDEKIDVVVDPNEYDENGEYNQNFGYWSLDKYGEVQIKEDRRCELDIDMDVVVHGNESVTVILPAGNYRVIEDKDWSWRYKASRTEENVTLSTENPNPKIIFENSRTNSDGLSGGSWLINEWIDKFVVKKPEEILS